MLQVESIFWKIQWHYFCSPAAVHDKIMEQIKDVGSLKTQEISVYWVGMAEVNICWLVIWGTKVIFAAIYKLFSTPHYIVMSAIVPMAASLVLTSLLMYVSTSECANYGFIRRMVPGWGNVHGVFRWLWKILCDSEAKTWKVSFISLFHADQLVFFT